jgi:hypothetical protein
MKTKKIILSTLVVLAVIAFVAPGCKKEKNEDDTETTATEDNAFAEANFNDLLTIADQANDGQVDNYYSPGYADAGMLSGCAKVIADTAAKSLVVDFGTVNCLCKDGRNRRGKVLINYTGKRYVDSNASITIVTQDYFVDDNQVVGTKKVINKGHINGHLTWDITVDGKIVVANNGGTITWKANRRRELLAGELANGKINWLIAKIGVTGDATGTSANGTVFTAKITEQLVRNMSCGLYRRFFVAGKFEFTPGSKLTRYVDYGTGDCDNIATVKIGNNTYTIHLR